MSRYKLAVFDLDGTILNTLDDLYDSVSEALRRSGFPLRTEDEVRMALGRGFQHLIHECVPEGTDPDREAETLSDFEAVYAEHCADKTRPYDGVLDAAAEIRKAGVHTAVLSNKSDEAVQALSDAYFPGIFECLAGEKTGIPRKPEPDAVWALMEKFGASKENTVYIGDSEVDIATGKNAGCGMISVTWGFRTKDALVQSGASRMVDTPEELVREVVGINK